jgi:hypothetical protein
MMPLKKQWRLIKNPKKESHLIGFMVKLWVSFASFGGWIPFGPERIITKSEANILYEIDGQPALDLIKNTWVIRQKNYHKPLYYIL